jgi:signal transduction histidine kinase
MQQQAFDPLSNPLRKRRPMTRLMIAIPFFFAVMVAITSSINYTIFFITIEEAFPYPVQQHKELLNITLTISIILMIVAGISGLFLSKIVTLDLRKLITGMEELAESGRAKKITLTGTEELALLGESFNHIVTSTSKYLPEHSRFIFHNVNSGVLSFNDQGLFKLINAAADRMLELDGAGIAHVHVDDIFPPDSGYKELGEIFNPVNVLKNNLENHEVQITTNKGNTKALGVSTVAVPAVSGSGTEIVATLMDLGRIKEINERMLQVEKLSAVGSLAAGVAHEIRNPLASLRGLTQLLLDKKPGKSERNLEDEINRFGEVMIKEIDRLNHVVTRLLDFSAQSKDAWENSDLKELVQRGLELAGHKIRKKDIQVGVEIEEGLPKVQWCEEKILQGLLNIIINGSEAAPRHGTMNIRAWHERGEKQDMLVISISNSGPQLSKEQLKQLFLPYYTTKQSGVGLGLAITQQVIMLHGGRLIAENTSEGVEFRVTFPVEYEDGLLKTAKIESSTELVNNNGSE